MYDPNPDPDSAGYTDDDDDRADCLAAILAAEAEEDQMINDEDGEN